MLPAGFHRATRPVVLAHRGASAEAPENTAAAFRLALERGADGVELDVWRCATGEVVVVHDEDLERLAGQPVSVRRAPWSTLRGLDVGSWFQPRFAGERLLTLPEALECLGPAALVNVELKGERLGDPGLPAAVAKILGAAPSPERFVVSSFNPALLWRFAAAVRGLSPARRPASALLFEPGQAWPFRHAAAASWLRPSALHPAVELCRVRELRRWRAAGYDVTAWTVDDPAVALALWEARVTGVITNRPKEILAAFDART